MEEFETITLLDENGEEIVFEILGVINVEDTDYAILTPLIEDEEDEEGEAYIFRIDVDEEGNEVFFEEVEDDEEFEILRDAWEMLCMDELESFDEDDDSDGEDEQV